MHEIKISRELNANEHQMDSVDITVSKNHNIDWQVKKTQLHILLFCIF